MGDQAKINVTAVYGTLSEAGVWMRVIRGLEVVDGVVRVRRVERDESGVPGMRETLPPVFYSILRDSKIRDEVVGVIVAEAKRQAERVFEGLRGRERAVTA